MPISLASVNGAWSGLSRHAQPRGNRVRRENPLPPTLPAGRTRNASPAGRQNRLEPISPNLEHGRRRYRRCFPPMSNATGRPGEPCFPACHGNGRGSVHQPVVARRPRSIRSSQSACGAPSLQPTCWSFAGISAKGRWDPGRADYQRGWENPTRSSAPWPPDTNSIPL